MNEFPKSITTENFDQALSFISENSAKVKKKKLIKSIVKPVGSLLFTFLSVLLIYGALYKYSSPEEIIVFEKFGFLTNIWNGLSNLVTNSEMVWYVYWLVLIATIFVIPLLVSAIISIIVSLCFKTSELQISDTTDIEKAKKLNDMAIKLRKESNNYDSDSLKTICKWIFILVISAFLVYAFMTIKMTFAVSMLLGFVVAAVILYFVYGLIFNCFYAINKLFYKKTYIYKITDLTDEYWVSVDPQEKKRREKEAEESRKAKEKKKSYATSSSTTSSSTSGAIDEHDSFTWTYGYVRDNETACSDVALGIQKVSKEFLAEGEYGAAAVGFSKVVRALELLQFIDEEYYQSPLFANSYALSRIFAFGLGDREKAIEYAQKACEYASKCGDYSRANYESARRDLVVIKEFLDDLKSYKSLQSIADSYIETFPEDILNMN